MDELVRWLGERLDEDERIARAASEYAEAEWHLNDIGDTILCFAPEPHVAETERRHGLPVTADQWRGITIDHASIVPHIALHDPARVLRETDAKRRLLALWEESDRQAESDQRYAESHGTSPDGFPAGRVDALEDVLRLVVGVYRDRDGFREEWSL